MWSEGDIALLRYVFRGRVRWAIPQAFAGETDGSVLLYCRPGTPAKRAAHSFFDDPEEIRREQWEYVDFAWQKHHVLWRQRLDRPHSLGLFWNESWDFQGWYVNLQEPVRRSPLGFDTRDQALDITIAPDGTWAWKDEDHLAFLVEHGACTAEEAAVIRAEGERVMEEWPFPTGWEEWRPDPGWPVPTLPDGWDVV